MVQDLYDAGKIGMINDYCRCDVLDTYFVFLRTQVVLGKLTLDREQQLVQHTRQWLEAQRDSIGGFDDYLTRWGEWHNPWVAQPPSHEEPEASTPAPARSDP